ncbi:MAG TPA: hypothetical protein VIK20_01425 [Bacteroidales bacterium]
MKTRWIILPALALLLPVLAQAQSSSYEDDLYYNPKKTKVETPQRESSNVREESTQDESVRVYDNSGTLKRYDTRNVDEYNRRAPQSNSEEAVENVSDSLDENGQPFEYAERVRRFHDPKFTTHITDEEYLDIYIEDGADVDVYYVDNNSNGWMSPFYFDNFYYPRYGYRWNNYNMYYNPWGYSSWGFYDPWYAGSYGWDYGFGGSYYGYGYGYSGYYGYGGYNNYGGGGHYHGDMGDGGHSRYNRLNADQRRFLSNNGSGRTSTTRTSSTAGRAASASRSAYGASVRSDNSTTTRSGSGTTTRTSSGTTTRSNVGTTTRSSSSTTTAPAATTVTRTSRSGSSSSETRSSTPTESTSRSTYTPSSTSSSSSRSSYTPSSSSSNSSSSGSSSSSRSSGGSSSGGRR